MEYSGVLTTHFTDEELSRLNEKYGTQLTNDAIEYLDLYIKDKGDKYKDHNATIRRWVIDAVLEKQNRRAPAAPKQGYDWARL